MVPAEQGLPGGYAEHPQRSEVDGTGDVMSRSPRKGKPFALKDWPEQEPTLSDGYTSDVSAGRHAFAAHGGDLPVSWTWGAAKAWHPAVEIAITFVTGK